MINILEMAVLQEKGVIRNTIQSPQGVIEIYEPTMEQVTEIVKMGIDNNEDSFDTGVMQFDADMLINRIFPMVTNIELRDTDEEKLKEIIRNPSIHLIMAQQAVELIIHECMTLYSMRMQSELKGAESAMAQVELLNSIPQYVLEVARQDGRSAEVAEKYKEVSEKIDSIVSAEKEAESE